MIGLGLQLEVSKFCEQPILALQSSRAAGDASYCWRLTVGLALRRVPMEL